MPKKPLKPIPEFASETDERAFWETHSSVDYVDWDQAIEVPADALPLLKRSTPEMPVTVPLPQNDVHELHALAQQRGVAPDRLAAALLHEGIEKARKSA